jgi:tetratricopeptide (TPR) repeat protein
VIGAPTVGDDSEQSRHRAQNTSGEGEWSGTAERGARGLSRGAQGVHARSGTAAMGDNSDEPRQRALDARRTTGQDGAQEEALGAFREALARDPLPIDRANTVFNMGLALIALGRQAEALNGFRQAQAVFRAAGMVQLAEGCDRLIILLREEIEKGPDTTPTSSKTHLN